MKKIWNYSGHFLPYRLIEVPVYNVSLYSDPF